METKPDPERLLRQLDPADLASNASTPSQLGRDLLGHTSPSVQPGMRLGDRFVVVRRLGQGAMGLVLEAHDVEADRSVALKLLLAHRDTPKLRARLQREAELTARVDHPSVLKIHGVAVHEGHPILVYELVRDARTLNEVFPGLGLEARLRILEQVAEALGAAHALGVVHRDLKPENVLIDRENVPRVADFGLALDLGGERLTQTGALLGSPCYMAPEQVTGKRDRVGPATDVWALGVMLFELVTNSLPFSGASLVELAAQICGDGHPTLRSRGARVAPALEAVVRRALAIEGSRRFSDGAAFAAALREAQRSSSAVLKPVVVSVLALLLVCGFALTFLLSDTSRMRADGSVSVSPADPATEASPEPDPPPAAELPPEAEPASEIPATPLANTPAPPPALPVAPPTPFVLPPAPATPLALPWEQTFPNALGAVFQDETVLVVVTRKKLVHVDLRGGSVVREVPLPSSLAGVAGRALRFKRKVLVVDAAWRSFTPAVNSLLKVGAAALDPAGERVAYSLGSVAFVATPGTETQSALKFLHVAKIQRLAISSSHLVACSRMSVSWWDVKTGRKVGFVDPIHAEAVALDPRTQTVLVGDQDGRVLTFDLKTSEQLQLFLPRASPLAGNRSHEDRVAQVDYLTGGQRLFSIARGASKVRVGAALWSRGGTPVWKSPAVEGGFTHFAVSPSEAHVALTKAGTGSVRVLRLPPPPPQ